MKKLFGRILGILLALSLLCASAVAEPVASRIRDDGLLRVYLKSIAGKKSLFLTLKGVYSVDGNPDLRFATDTTLQLSEGGGSVYMAVGGMTMNMGKSFSLTRHASDSEEKGIYIAESERNTLYMGDLAITARDGGLHAVLTIGMEDYLMGVVGYEMNNSWPVEALKAQAVAARTYAMQRKANAGDRDYDVVDTTGDQVYRGYDERHVNVHQAVRETAGVVGTWKGQYASCYYGASNGGETAMPGDIWGTAGDYGYMEMKADPYDLENPESRVLSCSIQADGSGNPQLRAMLDERLGAAAEAQGLNSDGIALEQIISVEPIEPAVAGSRMYTRLRFTIGASAIESGYRPTEADVAAPLPAAEGETANMALGGMELLRRLLESLPFEYAQERKMLSAPVVVELDVYEDIKGSLGLSMNSRDCELVSVRRDDEAGFTIEMRRFGHGVGMSQRGAQVMAANHGMSAVEILGFYYPGMQLERISWDAPELSALEELPDSVKRAAPMATPAPLPPLEDGEYYAQVSLKDSDRLNLRAEPSTAANIVTQLTHGQDVIVCGDVDEAGWVPVRTAEHSGYVMLEYLQKK